MQLLKFGNHLINIESIIAIEIKELRVEVEVSSGKRLYFTEFKDQLTSYFTGKDFEYKLYGNQYNKIIELLQLE